MNRVVIGVGSNLDPGINIERARRILAQEQCLVSQSRFVRTAPIGPPDQPEYLNGAFLVRTELNRTDFKKYLQTVENRIGRERGPEKYGPRTIDLDIVVWNGEIVDNDYYERDFLRNAVLEVWADIEQDQDGDCKENL